MNRVVMHVLALAVVLWAAAVVPMPFVEVQPGSVRPVEELVELEASTGEVNGDLALLTTRQLTPNVAETVWIALHPERELLPASERAPTGIDLDVFFDLQERAFSTSFMTAVAVAAREVGVDVEFRTEAVVAHVLPDAPSAGVLEPGDVITSIDGTPVSSGSALVEELARSDEERPVTLTVRRDDQVRTPTIGLRRMPQADRPVLGIVVETIALDPELPFDASIDRDNIVGPSAGLMIALTAADLLLEEDLTAGRRIAGTGTITLDGTVGEISGMEQKARAAVAAGVDVLLVPIENLPEAAVASEAGIEVVGVRSFQDALAALRGDGEGVALDSGRDRGAAP